MGKGGRREFRKGIKTHQKRDKFPRTKKGGGGGGWKKQPLVGEPKTWTKEAANARAGGRKIL